MSLSGKVALITGAAQGLGKGFAGALLKHGAKVCLTDVNTEKGETTAARFQEEYGRDRAMFLPCDVCSESEVKNAFNKLMKQFGRLDIMVNNAGISNEVAIRQMVTINLIGLMVGTNLAIEVMSKENGGHGGTVINVASTAGLTPKVYTSPAYTGSKYGVVGFTLSWAHNPYLGRSGLRFACLCPAFTDTDILQSINSSLYPDDGKMLVEMVGINKVSTVVDGFMQLVQHEDCNGAVMTVIPGKGVQYHKKPLAVGRL